MAAPSAAEQLMLELMNRARLDPVAEAARYGLSSASVSPGQKQPLAFNLDLIDAARSHTQWMVSNGVLSHTGSGGSSPGDRMQAAGYSFSGSWTWGENVAYSGGTVNSAPESHHGLFFNSSGHRANILNDSFKEAGVGILGSGRVFTTEDFARSGTGSFVTGVAYRDSDKNAFYSIGEGDGGLNVQLLRGSSALASTATWDSGGYSLMTTATGEITVKFSGGSLAGPVGATIAMGSVNAKVDLVNGRKVLSSVDATLWGDTLNLKLLGINGTDGTGNAANNVIGGNKGDNTLRGLDGNDILRGQDGDDSLIATAGDDRLNGGAGNDTLNGGAGSDRFVFAGSFGNDVINGFEDGLDKLRFINSGQIDFADLTISGNGTDSVSVRVNGSSIEVNGAGPITLTASDFEFLS
jgi:Ca2+-binding RTX toxin-like protein